MKRFFLKATIISFVLSVAIAFFSCSGTLDGYGPIFYNITKEVELEDAVVTGNVYSLVDAGAFLYTCRRDGAGRGHLQMGSDHQPVIFPQGQHKDI